MILENENPRRFAVFVMHDKDGIVDDYVHFFLRELHETVQKIRVVVNGSLNEEGVEKLRSVCDDMLFRENTGYDITAYKEGLLAEGYELLSTYDEVMVLNSTMYGPLYPFEEMFSAMAKKDLDFWGITAFHEVPFDPFGTIACGYIPRHVQSFFQVFRKSLVDSEDFRAWWDNLPEIHSYEEAIGSHEAVFTKAMEEKGYRSGVYCDVPELEGFTWDPLRDFPRYLVEKKRCPVLKLRSFYHDYGEAFSRSGGEATYLAFRYVKEHCAYNTDLIWANLLRTQHMADLRKRMHVNYVLSSTMEYPVPEKRIPLKVALVLHIYFEDLAEECARYAANMPEGCDFLITVPSYKKMMRIKPAFAELEKTHNILWRVTGNRGRDVAPFLVGLKDVIFNYDLVLKLHDKKVQQAQPHSIGRSWSYQCFESLIRTPEFVRNVIRLFESESRLGILSPPPPVHGPYFPIVGHGEWGENYQVTADLAEKLGIHVPMSPDKEPEAPLGSEFWVRTAALRTLFAHDFTYDEFPEEPIDVDATVLHAIERLYPYAAQADGYVSGRLTSDSFARIHLDNMTYINDAMLDAEAHRLGGYWPLPEMTARLKES